MHGLDILVYNSDYQGVIIDSTRHLTVSKDQTRYTKRKNEFKHALIVRPARFFSQAETTKHLKWASLAIFILICYMFYEQGARALRERQQPLIERLHALEERKAHLQNENEKLKRQIATLNDPDAIELMLKRQLGVVSRGQVKAYFPP